MSKKFLLVLLMVLALSLSACTRAASSASTGTPTPKVNFPKPLATSGMNAIEIAGTQTAVATAGMPMPTAAGTAKTPVDVLTITPLAGTLPTAVVITPLPSLTPAVLATAIVSTPVPHVTAGPIVKPGTYVLHQGEFPYCLARRFNVNPEELLTLNGLSSSQSEYTPGMTISIPQSGGTFPGQRSRRAHPTQHTVLTGDTIYSIACDFGDVDPMGIVSVNGLSGSYALTVGSTIQIP
jgi:LysM repeat protein